MLSAISKKIIASRLYDKGIIIDPASLDNYIIDTNNFSDMNSMYEYVTNNYNKLIIE
jgi:hypothetical protein